MTYKLVCIDMDGTLLTPTHNVSKNTKIALRKAHELGVEIVVTTGRIYNNAKYYSDLIGVASPVIAANGAVIIEKDTNNIIYKNTLTKKNCIDIINICNKYRVVPHFHTKNKVLVGNNLHKVMSSAILSWKLPKQLRVGGVIAKNQNEWNEILNNYSDEVFKCIIFNSSKEKLKDIRSELENIEDIVVASSSKNNLEINAKGVSKGSAVKFLAEYYKLDKESIICIGDNENDISMIKEAGLGVAMGNAPDFVKNEADYITDTNSNDGIAKVINNFILK